MEIVNLALGTTNLTNKEIETSIMSLAFTLTAPPNDVIDVRTVLDTVCGAMELNITKQDGSNTQTLVQSLLVSDLAEICSHNNGVVKIKRTNSVCLVSFTLDFSIDASLMLDDKAKLMVALSSIPETTQVIIDGIDSSESTTSYIKYDPKYVTANTSKDFNIDSAYALAIPIENLKALELTFFVTGKTVKLSKREVKQILTDAQDPIYNDGGLVTFGYKKFAVLSVEGVTNMRLTLDASTNFYLLKNQTV